MEHPKPTFEQLLEDNKGSIFRICRIYSSSPIEPEDLFQEIVVQVWNAYSTFQGKSDINTWVYRIALNVCLRYKSRSERLDKKTLGLDAIQFELASLDQDHYQKAQFIALKGCINQFDELNQSIVILSLDELSYKEISEITGLAENTVAVRMKRIREKLLNCITSKLK